MTALERLAAAISAIDRAIFHGVDREIELALQAEYYVAWAEAVEQRQPFYGCQECEA